MKPRAKDPLWIVRQSATPRTLELYIYDDVEEDGYWWGEKIKSETSASLFVKAIEEAGDVDYINLYINSYGGSVKEGLAIHNILKRHKAHKTAYIDGFACSIASVIPMCCDKVIICQNGVMMLHHASWGAYGNAIELRKSADDLDVIDSASVSSYLAKAGDKLTPDTLTELLDAETWLNAEQCLVYGLADEIAGQQSVVALAQQRYRQSVALELAALATPPTIPNQYASLSNMERLKIIFTKEN